MKLQFEFRVRNLLVTCCCAMAMAETTPSASLSEVIIQHYHPVRVEAIGRDAGRPAPVSAVTVQLPGIISVPDNSVAYLDVCPSIYRAGQIFSTAGSFCDNFASQNKRYLAVKEVAYVTSVQVNPISSELLFSLVSCGACEAKRPMVLYRSKLVFDFPRGYLRDAPAEELFRTIDRTLTAVQPAESASNTGAKQQKQQSTSANADERPASAPPSTSASAIRCQTNASPPGTVLATGEQEPAKCAAAAETNADSAEQPIAATSPVAAKVLKKGQSREEIIAILGKPDQAVELGPKQIYCYRDLKVVFLSGKLIDIE